jgi:hypothetical protein
MRRFATVATATAAAAIATALTVGATPLLGVLGFIF